MSHIAAAAADPLAPKPTRCELAHPVFTTFGDVQFRRADTDGTPVLTMQLGERKAQIPLDALRREFAIATGSADGRMLALIATSLDYVACLRPGDRLPSEVLTGQASWKPSPNHLRLAATRLRLNLVTWLSPASQWATCPRDELTLLRLADDPALLRDVQVAAMAAARHLALPDAAEVTRLMAALAEELSYIEALRQRLLVRVEALCRRVSALFGSRRCRGVAADTLSQVHRLGMLAFRQFRVRFDDLDALTAVFDTLARNVDGLRGFIRSTRDWLYCSQRAWEPLLARWDQAAAGASDEVSALLTASYQFLAPRFMPTTKWPGARPAAPLRRMHPAVPAPMQMAW